MASSNTKTRLAVTDLGPRQAPVVVLLHSIATHSAVWSLQIPVWSQHFRILAIDLPGHGSSAPDSKLNSLTRYAGRLNEILDDYEIERCGIVGLSLGGMIGQAFALEFPRRLAALVLANTSARTPVAMQERWKERKQQALEAGMECQVKGTLERWFTPEFARAHPMTLEWVADMVRSTLPQGYANAIEAIQSTDLLDRLAAINAPVMLLAGRRDVATTVEIMQTMSERIPGALLHVLPEASHIGNLSQPAEFTEAAGAFLQVSLR